MSSVDATYSIGVSILGDQQASVTYTFYSGETPLTETQKDEAFQAFVDYLEAYPNVNPDGEGNATYGWKSWSEETMFAPTPEEE